MTKLKSTKKKPLKMRGVRMSDDTWDKILDKSEQDGTLPSDVIRSAVSAFLNG